MGTDEGEHAGGGKISSERLAYLIVDAMLDAGILSREVLQKALDIAKEEIDARKAMGDY